MTCCPRGSSSQSASVDSRLSRLGKSAVDRSVTAIWSRMSAADAPSADDLETAFASIEDNPAIHEVILTGGDPLSLSDARLRRIVDRLNGISHLNNILMRNNPF